MDGSNQRYLLGRQDLHSIVPATGVGLTLLSVVKPIGEIVDQETWCSAPDRRGAVPAAPRGRGREGDRRRRGNERNIVGSKMFQQCPRAAIDNSDPSMAFNGGVTATTDRTSSVPDD